jgi:hypothetical protein
MRVGGWKTCRSCLLAAALSVLALDGAHAAVRKCGDFIAAAGEARGSEVAARQKAMTGWIESAGKLGPAYSAWRLAIDKSLSCLKLADGTHRCQAMGRPCGIAQAPDTLPPGTDPATPIKPKREQRI